MRVPWKKLYAVFFYYLVWSWRIFENCIVRSCLFSPSHSAARTGVLGRCIGWPSPWTTTLWRVLEAETWRLNSGRWYNTDVYSRSYRSFIMDLLALNLVILQIYVCACFVWARLLCMCENTSVHVWIRVFLIWYDLFNNWFQFHRFQLKSHLPRMVLYLDFNLFTTNYHKWCSIRPGKLSYYICNAK